MNEPLSAEIDAGYCDDLADVLGIEHREGYLPSICCDSCHDDWNEGYDAPSEVEHEGRTYRVCCALSRALDTCVTPPGQGQADG